MENQELDRARHIHERLGGLRSSELLEKYSKRLKGAPAELMDNGLLLMLAFYYSKSDPEYELIAEDLTHWLRQRRLLPDGDPLRELARLDAHRYRRCSEEAIAWLNWAKRLAVAKVAMQEGAP